MPLVILLYFLQAQHVSGTIMPIIRSSQLWCWLPHWSFRSWFAVCCRLGAVRLEFPGCRYSIYSIYRCYVRCGPNCRKLLDELFPVKNAVST